MTLEPSISEAHRLAAWARAVRQSTLKRLRQVPEGRENWRPAAAALSFADIAQHLVDADDWLFAKLADPDIPRMRAVAGSAVVASRAEFEGLLGRLTITGDCRTLTLARMTDEQLARAMPDDRFGGEVTTWWVIVRGNLDHEAHHRGQLAVYLRLVGTPNTGDPATAAPRREI
jgi:uncharacterized damage-inducible protein DinB